MQYRPLIDVDWKWNDAGGEFFNMGMMVLNKSFIKYLNNTDKSWIAKSM